ncbi:MAG TPA: ATP-binding protein [Candidatus Methylomirabilis sp.]|nr:ATP-binding protein [Candidatus Methylomirabilis sp.]
MQGGERKTLRGRVLAYQHWIPPAVLVLGIVATSILIWAFQIIERESVSFRQIEALEDIRIKATTFHLWLEEAVAGGSTEDFQRTVQDLAGAMKLSHALLHGGETERGAPLPPIEEPGDRREVEKIGKLLGDYRDIALKRYASPWAAGIGSDLDRQCNAVFRELQEAIEDYEEPAEKKQIVDHANSRRLLFSAIFLWTLVVAVTTVTFHKMERRRSRAELALERAYDDMEQNVLIRTADLAEANRQLEREIADRERAEVSLRASEEEFRRLSLQFQTVLDTIPDSISLVSPDLKVRWANRSAGVQPWVETEDPGGGHCHRLQHDESSPCNGCPAIRSFTSGKPESALITTADGRQWDIRTVPIVREDGTIESVLEVASDITEKISLQAETMRTAHLASIGELAAGVAHEINNPINGIINYARILSNKSDGESQEHDLANRILREGRRIADIVRGLLLFARGGKRNKAAIHVREILSDSLGLTGSQLRKEGIDVQSAIPDDLPEVIADPQEMQQVFMNIISNSRYALNQKYPGRHDEKSLQIRAVRVAGGTSGPCVRITFHDRGVGIPAGIIEKIRDPFYSTKPAGKGTGLGLSISDGIISEHGGKLSIESAEGESTTVIIDLPAREKGNGQNPRH